MHSSNVMITSNRVIRGKRMKTKFLLHLLLGVLSGIFVLTSCIAAQNKPSTCGTRVLSKEFLIARGQDANPGNWPWHVRIMHWSEPGRRNGTWEFQCGGSLVNEHIILTAQHCVNVESAANIAVEVGDKRYVAYEIDIVGFGRWNGKNNDIALLQLRTAVQLSDLVQPVCLPDRDVVIGETGTVVGYGLTESGKVSQRLQLARMPVIHPITCTNSDDNWYGALDETNFCAGRLNGTAVCKGDSGGGLVFRRDGFWQVGGIVSFAPPHEEDARLCNTNGYAAYTSVHEYKEWLTNEIANRGEPVDTLLAKNCGRRTGKSNQPWIVQVYKYQPSNKKWIHSMLGTLITRYIVLLNDHAYAHDSHKVIFGTTDAPNQLTDAQLKGTRYRDSRKLLFQKMYDDIVTLDNPVTFDDYKQPICLPVANEPLEALPERLVLIFQNNNQKLERKFVSKSSNPGCFSSDATETQSCLEEMGEANLSGRKFIAFAIDDERYVQYTSKIEAYASPQVFSINDQMINFRLGVMNELLKNIKLESLDVYKSV